MLWPEKTATMTAGARTRVSLLPRAIVGTLAAVALFMALLFTVGIVASALLAGWRPGAASEEGPRYIVEPVTSDFMGRGLVVSGDRAA
jgi:hypothetical protein